jgi:hypothetical protein
MQQETQDKKQSPKDKGNIDPDSFRGKIYFLVVDKILLGAIIAIAFVVYDQYKTHQEDKRSIEIQNIQIDFERLKMAREYWPQILDKKKTFYLGPFPFVLVCLPNRSINPKEPPFFLN